MKDFIREPCAPGFPSGTVLPGASGACLRELEEADITRELFASFVRTQVVTDCRRRVNRLWVIRRVPFTDDWGEAEYAELVRCLRNTVRTGGVVFGAFDGSLIGFCSVEPGMFGGENRYLDLSSLHVSREHRHRGIGRALLGAAVAYARGRGAGKLYISSHSSVESQLFYRAMGCIDAAEPNAAHTEAEPFDCQLELFVGGVLKIREQPALIPRAARWFSEKWGIPEAAYLSSMRDCAARGSAVPQWYIVTDGSRIVGGLGVIGNDFHPRTDLSPDVCALYVEDCYRRRGVAGELLRTAAGDLASLGVDTLYLLTDHTSFYERYGWEFLCPLRADGETHDSRMYIHRGQSRSV